MNVTNLFASAIVTFHPSVVKYSQCVWNEESIASRNSDIIKPLMADNHWHLFSEEAIELGYYRVYEGRYFQTLSRMGEINSLADFMALTPAAIGHDSDWLIWQLIEDNPSEGYGITSQFATTPGPFPYHQSICTWLSRHALDLEAYDTFVQGVAYFGDLEGDQLKDAIQRLDWLELVFRDVNQLIINYSGEFWKGIKLQSDMVAASNPEYNEEIIPTPDTYESMGWKKRIL